MVATSGDPLSQMQAEQLSQILASNSSAYKNGGKATIDTIDWDSALAQAAGILGPSKVEAL